MLTVTYNPGMHCQHELARTEVWMEADGTGFVVALVAVLVDGVRLLAGTAAGCHDQPSAIEVAERMLLHSKLGQSFVTYHWGRPALVPVQINPCLPPTCRRVA
jgi:hypothetical protein